jgi:septal ring-binding cell division protein DamX
MTDEGFHEIQLNGKQLVFTFMAATVVAVVIFLSGVMVGRGVRPANADLTAAVTDQAIDPTAPVATTSSSRAASADRPPVSTQEDLTYAERLEAPVPPRETLRDASETRREAEDPTASAAASAPPPAAPVEPRREPARRDAIAAAPVEPKPTTPAAAAAAPPVERASLAVPPGNGFVVQVGAYPQATADAIARGLAAKGFPTFILPRDKGLFAVRVGKYTDRREAEAVARRLETNEQFKKPWVTR